ncbi:FixH family protein [Novosphingobium soli]|uniref:FixH family protein n=1 Tax=Novosphingobium soli TaxID=574956 RepID=A0ABV6CU78_9SPHN
MTVPIRKTAPARFTGRHMTAILVAGFGVVIGVNVAMATLASTTFGGAVVENSYVASQDFNRWLDEAAREKALGWHLDARRGSGGVVVVDLALRHGQALRQAQDERGAPQAEGGRAFAPAREGPIPPRPAQAELVEAPAAPATLTAVARHPLGRLPDVALTFRREGERWVSEQALPPARWVLRFEVAGQGSRWRAEREIGA